MKKVGKRKYTKPSIHRVVLDPEQAVLSCCATYAGGKFQWVQPVGWECFWDQGCDGGSAHDSATPS